MSGLINLVLLYGGKSGEHEISLISAASVLANLNQERYHIIPIGIDKSGCFYVNELAELLNYKDALPVKTENSRPLTSLLENGRLAVSAEVVFPVVHGPLYEDGCLQGLLTLADVAYVGCDVLSSAIGMDKDIARRLAGIENIASAAYHTLSAQASVKEVEAFCERAALALKWPLFVKPCSMGSSVGIHKVNNKDELLLAIADARRYDDTILVEQNIKGREIEVSVMENVSGAPKVSLPGEIKVGHGDGFYSYSAKYLESDKTELIAPAHLSEEWVHRIQEAAATIFVALKCKGMARVDFFIDEQNNKIYFNEINTIPGFTPISMYPRMWQVSGLEYAALIDTLIELAIGQHRCRQQRVTHYQ